MQLEVMLWSKAMEGLAWPLAYPILVCDLGTSNKTSQHGSEEGVIGVWPGLELDVILRDNVSPRSLVPKA